MIAWDEHRSLVRELAAHPRGVWVTCAGRSMEPTLRPGDKVLVRKCRRLRAGDVVLFETADGRDYVLHRVIWAVPGVPWFLHAGDAAGGAGPRPARRSQVVGCARLARRRPPVSVVAGGLIAAARRALARAVRR